VYVCVCYVFSLYFCICLWLTNIRICDIQPWKGAIVAPDKAPKNNASAPDKKLTLNWVYVCICVFVLFLFVYTYVCVLRSI